MTININLGQTRRKPKTTKQLTNQLVKRLVNGLIKTLMNSVLKAKK